MRDFKAFVRDQISQLGLAPEREAKIVDEWAAALEEIYDALVGRGLSDEEAWSELQRQVPDWKALGEELLDVEPAILRVASARRGRATGHAILSALTVVRELATSGWLRDLRAGVRLLLRDRGFTATTVLTLAICLGANAAIFTVVQSVLLRPLGGPEPDRLVAMGDVYPTITPNDILSNDAPSYFDRLAALTTLEEQALFANWYDAIAVDGISEEIRGMRATPSLFRVLKAQPLLGRTFTDADGEPGADRKVILSHGLWQRLFAADPAAVGRDLRLGWTGQPYTIVGVMPRDFSFFDAGSDGHTSAGTQFWIPMTFTPEQRTDSARTRYGFFHVARLRPGATVDQVRAQLDALNAATFARLPQFGLAELGMYTAVTPLQAALTRNVRRILYLLWAGAGFVLLIGVINIAHLALARSHLRARELAMRVALGASRPQVIRQLLVEGLVPAAIGGMAGTAIGFWTVRALAATELAGFPNASRIHMDWAVIGVLAGLSAIVGLVIGLTGLAPTVTAPAFAINEILADGSRGGTGGRGARMFRRALVVVQVGASVVLLAGATLLLASFWNQLAIDAGFSAPRVTTGTVFPPPSRYPNRPAVIALSARMLDAIRSIPGVEAAGMTSNIALSGRTSPSTVSWADRPAVPGDPPLLPSVVTITPGYFEAMKTPLMRGRFFTDGDRLDTMPVAIVDERLAAKLWPAQDPIGQGLLRGNSVRFTVVGVVRSIHFESLAERDGSVGTAYFPETQTPVPGRLRWIAVRTTAESPATIAALRASLSKIDPDLPLSDIQTMTERTSRSLGAERLAMTLAAAFGIVALFLSMLGIYGLLAYVVARRQRELGIRLALGSTVRGVFYLIFGEGLALVALGLVLGTVGAIAMAGLLEGQIFGVQPADPRILGLVALGTGAAALFACVAPALRATRVDPVSALTGQSH